MQTTFENTSLDAVGILTFRKESLLESNSSSLPTSISIAQSRLDLFDVPAAEIDNVILPSITIINNKKQEIVNLCSLASTTIVVLGVTTTSCPLSSEASDVSSFYSDIIIGAGATAGINIGIGTSAVIGFGTVYADDLKGYISPNLENGVYSTNNPIENTAYSSITVSNAGAGRSTKLFENDSDSANLGIVVAIQTGLGVTCDGYASSISTLISEIVSIRAGLSSYINGATIVKNYKHSYQLGYWSLKRVEQKHTDDVAAIDAVLGILTDPSMISP